MRTTLLRTTSRKAGVVSLVSMNGSPAYARLPEIERVIELLLQSHDYRRKNSARDRKQVRCEDQIVVCADIAQYGTHLSEMPMIVADSIRTEILADFSEEQIGPRSVAGTCDAAGRIRGDRRALLDQAFARERCKREKYRGRVAARVRDDVGASNLVSARARLGRKERLSRSSRARGQAGDQTKGRLPWRQRHASAQPTRGKLRAAAR